MKILVDDTIMIKLTELRLHNTIGHGGEHCRVVQLSEDHVSLQRANGDYTGPVIEEDIEGISLTPALLARSGFIYSCDSDAYSFVLDHDSVLSVNPHIQGGYSVQLCVKGNWCGRPVQYLHELENIYLDLTGKELSVD